jgi:hypothetical protein
MPKMSVLSWLVPGLVVALAGCAKLPQLTDYVPAGAQAVAYVDLERARTSPLYARLPVPQDLQDASALLVAFDGKDWGTAVQRKAGIIATGIAKPERGGEDLLARAPRDAAAWIVTRGSVTLPLPGNLGNLNRLLHQADYVAAGLRGSDVDVTAECRTPEAARHLEGNIRALATLARFDAIDVSSAGTTVRVRATLR